MFAKHVENKKTARAVFLHSKRIKDPDLVWVLAFYAYLE